MSRKTRRKSFIDSLAESYGYKNYDTEIVIYTIGLLTVMTGLIAYSFYYMIKNI